MHLHEISDELDDVHYTETDETDENLHVDIVVIDGEENEYDDLYDDDNID